MRLIDMVPYNQLNVIKPKITANNFKLDRFSVPITGIEVEVENCDTDNIDRDYTSSWNIENDGSLRNGGIEFISKPTYPAHVETLLTNLLEKTLPDTIHFSPRTSIHVHLNCRELTLMQVYNIVILYQCFEDLFYNFAGPERKKSIFCVPVGNSSYYIDFKSIIQSKNLMNWSKYTGLNLAPLGSLGTIEFRHLRGTKNVNTICTWLELIYSLYNYAININTEQLESMIKTTRDEETYFTLGTSVFGSLFPTLCNNTMWDKAMRQDLSISKLFITNQSLKGII